MSENPNPSLPQGDHHRQSSPVPYQPPHLQSMRLPGQIDDVPSHAIIPHEEPLEHHHRHHYDHEEGHINEIPLEENVETMETAEGGTLGVMMAPGVGNQLTLSFQGEVYVFDSVSPEKVQAVLLLLGGRELTSGVPAGPPSSQPANKRSNFPQRVASLMRFREKRKERNFDKKIRYTVRKEVALRMHRNKGQFTSSKPKAVDAGAANWDSTQPWGVDDRPQAASSCHHCGTNVSSTPMMRRGPDGPRTLCNACGLMWANKGTLRDLSRSASIPIQNAALEQSMVDCNGSNGDSLPMMSANDGHGTQ